jgi:hypothetical protein
LTYDPRCGLSEAEFDEFLALSKTLTTGKVGEGILTISASGSEAYLLDGGEALPHLTGIEINLRNNVIQTPIGVAKDWAETSAGKDSFLGAWAGVRWTLEKAKTDSSPEVAVDFVVGELTDSKRGLIYYRVKEGGRTGRTTVLQIATFELPANH